jgi:hypothetical protein
MSLSAKLRRAPLRIATGAFILNSGLEKFRGDEEHAKGVHGMASGAYPQFDKVDHKLFFKGLAAAETALGAALLLPIVPPAAAGLGLAAYSGGLLGMYWRTPALHRDGDPRPTPEGIAIAKDSWMFGIGTSLVIDALATGAHEKRIEKTHQLKEAAAVTTAKAGTRARMARRVAAARAAEAGHVAAVRAAEAGHVAAVRAAEAGAAAQAAVVTKAAQAAALGAVAKDATKRVAEHVGH